MSHTEEVLLGTFHLTNEKYPFLEFLLGVQRLTFSYCQSYVTTDLVFPLRSKLVNFMLEKCVPYQGPEEGMPCFVIPHVNWASALLQWVGAER